MDYNVKYIFVAKEDTWFDEGTAVTVDCLWRNNDAQNNSEITLEEMLDSDYRKVGGISGIFEGFLNGKLDEEGCCVCEFNIQKREKE